MSVVANGLEVAGGATGHQVVLMAPSVCITPAAPSPIPIPYPLFIPTGTQNLDNASENTTIQDKPIALLCSTVKSCNGNEPGTQKEVVSLTTTGPTFFLVGSPNVKVEGAGVCYTTTQGMGNKMG